MKCRRCKRKWMIPVIILTAVLTAAGYTYVNNSYPADGEAWMAMESGNGVQISHPATNMTVFAPEEVECGLIFYPGGQVEHIAYAPLLRGLAEEGILCVLTEMPFDLAVLDMDAAESVREKVAGIEVWYLGGHSLGGAMAASYASEHAGEYEGLVLLAAYSTKDLKNKELKVISLYGSEDKILNMEKYNLCRENLPTSTVEAVLKGGNHAQFGCYGPQEGDGTALVSAEEQLSWTIDMISAELVGWTRDNI